MYRIVACPSCGQERKLRRPPKGQGGCQQCAIERYIAWQAEVDEAAVERLLSRAPVKSSRAERQAAVQYLTEHGYSARSIAERIGVSHRTVQRLQRRAREDAAA